MICIGIDLKGSECAIRLDGHQHRQVEHPRVFEHPPHQLGPRFDHSQEILARDSKHLAWLARHGAGGAQLARDQAKLAKRLHLKIFLYFTSLAKNTK
jgi:hypothetical protein